MRKTFIIWVICLLSVCYHQSFAQQITLPYFNGWEDEAENALWQMNSGMHGANASNKWYVSSKAHFHGSHSLLISDLGLSADTIPTYSNNTVSVIAARTFTLPKGTYDLSFAWRVFGEKNFDGLYVAWIPDNSDISTSVGLPPNWLKTASPYNGNMFNDQMAWTVERTTIVSQGRPMKLVFVWVNDNKNAAIPSVCIDDVQIAADECGKPLSLKADVNGKDVELAWTANPNATYEVWYSSEYAGVSDTVSNIRGGRVILTDLPKGAYNIYVRTVCNSGAKSVWCSNLGIIVNEGLCLDYADLHGLGVTCYLGSVTNPYMEVKVDENGIAGESPRHTVNTDIYEIDPRTGGNLKVIPDGGFVSIRLGNEYAMNKAEAIEYDMQLDSGANTVLLMQYAIVLQVPDAHPIDAMPWFKLDILDENGVPIDETCGSIYFYSDLSLMGEGWKRYDIYNKEQNIMEPLLYKDWTTMGIMLEDYAKNGPTSIKVRLTTRDCTQSAHFGYAYFTLDCIEGEISGLTCGDNPIEEVRAPEGFAYRWYLESDPDKTIVSDSIVLKVNPGDIGTYLCDVISKENPNCYFTLRAELMPRFPKAKVNTMWSPENCQNFIRFENLSYIETEAGVSDENITDFVWEFSDGTTSTDKNPILLMPDEGGTLQIKLTASIVDGMCYDVWDSTIIVPPIGEIRDTSYVNICRGGKPYIIDGIPYIDTEDVSLPPLKSKITGCDSIHVVRITAVDSYESTIDTTICAADTVTVGNSKFWFSGNFRKTLKSAGGCDSIVNLNLTVLPEVSFNYEVRGAIDGLNTGAVILKDTLPGTWYTINGEKNGRLDSLPVGIYTIVCYNEYDCPGSPVELHIGAECLEAEIGVPGEICRGDEAICLPVKILSGGLTGYTLRFSDNEHQAGFIDATDVPLVDDCIKIDLPATVRPDRYSVNVILPDHSCGDKTVKVNFSVLYPDSIMYQKWNDVVALKNDRYNGGYLFTAYQWYLNGTLLPGMTAPYLYLGSDITFADGDEVRVEVTRADDGVTLLSCPLVITTHKDTQPYPTETYVAARSIVAVANVKHEVIVRIWSIGGIYYGEQYLNTHAPNFTSPANSGLYIMKIISSDSESEYKLFVQKQ